MLRPNKILLPSNHSFDVQSEPASPPDTPLANRLPKPLSSPTLPPSPSSSTACPTASASMMTAIRENIQVMARIRPLSPEEQAAEQGSSCWVLGPANGMISTQESGRRDMTVFQFDAVISGTDNKAVYDIGIGDLVRSTMAGYNGTVFAYGQTASGKTYTMMGTDEEPGVIPRAVNDLFAYIEENPGREYLLRVSYMEIYKEKIRDLIAKAGDDRVPEVHEDKKRGVYVTNLREVCASSAEQVMDIIKQGERNRHVGETDYNTRSSRSHTIFQIVIESRIKNPCSNKSETVCISQLNLIDLAGSERATTDKDRRAEGSYINKSLLALGNVISQLTARQNCDQSNVFVPYRTSTLTRVLQTALSGNARVSVVCAINPTLKCRNESISTLRFAQRAKQIRTAAKMTKIKENSKLREYKEKIEMLQTYMQEKTEREEETRDRLNHLLSIILTSSRTSSVVPIMTPNSTASVTEFFPGETMNDMFTQCEQGLNMHREAMSRLEYELSNSEEEKMYLTTRLQMAQNKSEELAGKLAETENTYAALAESYKELMIERKALEKQWQQSCQLEKMLEQNMESLQADLTKMLDAKKQYDKEMAEKLQTLAEAAKVEKRSIGEYVQCMESKIEDGHRRTQNVELQLGQAQREIESLRSEVRTAANETLAAIQRVSRQEQEEMRSQKEMMRQERNEFAASIALLVAKVETSANKLEKAMEDQDLQIKKQEEHCKTQPSIVTEPQTEGRQKMTLGIDKHVTVCSLIGAAMYAGLAFICI